MLQTPKNSSKSIGRKQTKTGLLTSRELSARCSKIEETSRNLKNLATSQKIKKIRHSSVLAIHDDQNRQEIDLKVYFSRKANYDSSYKRQLPNIYHFEPNSTKKFNIITQQIKNKKNSRSQIMEFKKTQIFFNKQRKTQYNRKSVKVGLRDRRNSKDCTKPDQAQNFKIIRFQFLHLLAQTNKINIVNPETCFRAYIQKGNNGSVIKQLLKKRYWWHIEQKHKSKANLIWTQWLQRSIVDTLVEKQSDSTAFYKKDYQYRQTNEVQNQKEELIRRITDGETFHKIQINHKNGGYLNFSKGQCEQKTTQETIQVNSSTVVHNHVDGGIHLHSKKLLFKNFYELMKKKQWNPYEFLPLTFYIHQANSPILGQLFQTYEKIAQENPKSKNIWICKEENCNRGNGITVLKDKDAILRELKIRFEKNPKKTIIIQKYLENCFLINNRKFDIRCYILLTTINGRLKGYWYRDGYIRTSSEEYSLEDLSNVFIHLTNDAIQKKSQFFSKYEENNKMNFEGFKKYLQRINIEEKQFQKAYEQMKMIAFYLIASVKGKIKRRQYSFELFGLDYMLDVELNPYLIEANSNPALDTSGKIMGSMMYNLIDNVLMLGVDSVFQPPPQSHRQVDIISKDYFESNRFELIFSD